jgi:endonuclease YncB( thermonuclease family)
VVRAVATIALAFKEITMSRLGKLSAFACLLLGYALQPLSGAYAGDSLYGTVADVKSADVVTFDYGSGRYDIRLIGIEAPKEGPISREATQFVANLVRGKKARMRFEFRAPNGQMVSRLFTDDPATGIKEVGVELVRAGLARRQKDYDYKYGELSAAENEAQNARRGLWKPQ